VREANQAMASAQRFSRIVNLTRGGAHRRMQEIWNHDLYPKLTATAGPATNVPLVEIDPDAVRGSNFDWGGFESLDRRKMRYMESGIIRFGNPHRRLTNVVARIRMHNEAGDHATWYAYFPALGPGQYIESSPPANFSEFLYFSREISYDISIACDQGRNPDIALPVRKWREDYLPGPNEDVEGTRKWQNNLMPRTNDVWQLLPAMFPVCPVPEATRRQLIRTFGRNQSYYWGNEKYGLMVTCGPFEDTTNVITLTLVSTNATSLWTNTFKGRFVSEVERGTVLTFEQVHNSSRGASSSRSGASQFIRLLSAPTEIADFTIYKRNANMRNQLPYFDAFMIAAGRGSAIFDVTTHSRELTANADCVLSVDASGDPWIQSGADREGQVYLSRLVSVQNVNASPVGR
jgi:hypothetical protein